LTTDLALLNAYAHYITTNGEAHLAGYARRLEGMDFSGVS
jgi:hypothetical protein